MKPLKGNEDYFINEEGECFSKKYHHRSNRNCELKKLKPSVNSAGYLNISICNNKKKTTRTIHRLVAEAYIPNPENKRCVNHKNGIKTDCRAVNLEWATDAENKQHAIDNKLIKVSCGENHYNAKLTQLQVNNIRLDTRIHKMIALDYMVSQATISEIKAQKIWKSSLQ